MIFRKLEFISHQKGEKKQSRTHEKKKLLFQNVKLAFCNIEEWILINGCRF